jgi:hypothetical protein
MLPARFAEVDEFPSSPTGKLDRRAVLAAVDLPGAQAAPVASTVTTTAPDE